MIRDSKSVSGIRTYHEFVEKYFPSRAQQLFQSGQIRPYEQGVAAAGKSLEEIGLKQTQSSLSRLKDK